MIDNFKIYGYESEEEDTILQLNQVTLAFRDIDEVGKFHAFFGRCLDELSNAKDWDHKHFRSSRGLSDIVVAMLDERNL